jgi:hypothetical protein
MSEPTPAPAATIATRIAAVVVMAGVVAQATLAGGFLAGHEGWHRVHDVVGSALPLAGLVLVVAGLAVRRVESAQLLATRVTVFVALVVEVVAGKAADGTPNLLILHIPLAIVIIGGAATISTAARAQAAGTRTAS